MAKKALELGVSLKDRIDSFATDCGWNSSVKNVLIKGLQAIGVGAAIGTAAAVATEAGLVAGLTAGAGIFIAGEATAKATDLSAEAAVTYAISQADTEEEAQSYADLFFVRKANCYKSVIYQKGTSQPSHYAVAAPPAFR